MWQLVNFVLVWARRLAPALVMASLFFALDGGLKWLGLMSLPLFFLAFRSDVPSCACRTDGQSGAPIWPSL